VGETRILMAILDLLIAGEKDQQEGGQNLLASSPPLTSGSFLSLASSQGKGASKNGGCIILFFGSTQRKCGLKDKNKI
jgi:hypothetical protein